VLAAGGQPPAGKQSSFAFNVPGAAGKAAGGAWSDWLRFARPQVEAELRTYPAMYMGRFPLVIHLQTAGVVDPTVLQAELRFDENDASTILQAELFGPSLGIMLWRDDGKQPHAATMAEYNRRYCQVLDNPSFPTSERPKRFPLVDRFIGGDDDRRDWGQGIQQLARAGLTAVSLPPIRPIRDLLRKAGLQRTAWAVYNPPGYAFDYDPSVTPASIDAWARRQARPYLDAGYARQDMALFAMSDEPGWYFPSMFRPLAANPVLLGRFHDYLKAQGLTPAALGGTSWEGLRPIGRSHVTDLHSRRLFYWSMRFFSWDSSRHFARCTRALETAFYPGLPISTNWNFFSGRFYVPGPVASNPDKTNPDAAMGGHDWFEFGRLRGCTALWTEDWFSDGMAYQWSLYCAKMRCAAALGGVQFGGYVVPRAGGETPDGLLQKALCIIGSGGKAITYYTFGPEYNFPGNCYSDRPDLLRKIAESNYLIGRAEELLWPGRRPRSQVAILAPRSAELWDERDMSRPVQIQDATNTNQNAGTVDYMAEMADLYLALQHQNIPVDFVDEDQLSRASLQPYRVLYVTEPDIPAEAQEGVAAWVRAGGTLVTVTGAGTRDRYDEPCRTLCDLAGIRERPRGRLLVPALASLGSAGHGQGVCGGFAAVGPRGVVRVLLGQIEASFEDGSPAVVQRRVGRGRTLYYAWMPGLSYARSSRTTVGGLPAGFSETVRRWIVHPVRLAGVQPPVAVNRAMVETPILLSPHGAAVTLLNWTDQALGRVNLRVHLPRPIRSVESVRQGRLRFQRTGDGVSCSLPLGAADIVMLRQ
jgi:hypothetical protein